jgi:hypothetical protein
VPLAGIMTNVLILGIFIIAHCASCFIKRDT